MALVKSVSEDHLYHTIEFNEFLVMMANQVEDEINMENLMEAFRYYLVLRSCFYSPFLYQGFLTQKVPGSLPRSSCAR